jgi:hypothetical protein
VVPPEFDYYRIVLKAFNADLRTEILTSLCLLTGAFHKTFLLSTYSPWCLFSVKIHFATCPDPCILSIMTLYTSKSKNASPKNKKQSISLHRPLTPTTASLIKSSENSPNPQPPLLKAATTHPTPSLPY